MPSSIPEQISNIDLGITPAHPDAPLTVLLPGMDSTLPVRMPFYRALAARVPFQQLTIPTDRIAAFDEAEAYLRGRLPRDRPFVLAGYSYSGPLALRIAADPPPGLVALILIATFARIPLPIPGRLAMAMPWGLIFRIPAPGLLIRILAGCGDSMVITELKKAQKAVRPDILAARLRACLTVDARTELQAVPVPILNIIASRDSILPGAGERRLSELRPDARLTIIPGGHAVLECTPQLTADAIADFVVGLRTRFEHNAG